MFSVSSIQCGHGHATFFCSHVWELSILMCIAAGENLCILNEVEGWNWPWLHMIMSEANRFTTRNETWRLISAQEMFFWDACNELTNCRQIEIINAHVSHRTINDAGSTFFLSNQKDKSPWEIGRLCLSLLGAPTSTASSYTRLNWPIHLVVRSSVSFLYWDRKRMRWVNVVIYLPLSVPNLPARAIEMNDLCQVL